MFKKLQMTLVLVVMVSVSAFAQTRTIVGVVTDASTGETLTGVSIAVDGTQRGTSTNIDGEYSIRASSNNVLVFSFLGFSKQEIPVGNQTTINVALDQDIQNLDEVIVTGYGAIARRQITSSIGQVSSDQLADVSITTADQALQGRVAGVQITGTSGVLGAPTNIRIRGASSISASTVPLVVVDGVPITNPAGTGISAIGSGYGGQGINPLINLNPADIESYEVLKDASASAIYGSRGSNGVILITTKKGRSGSQNVSVNYYGGFTNETNRYDMMSGPEFAKIWNDALMNRYGQIVGLEVPEGDDAVSTDWGDIVAHTGFVQEGNASVSGGNDATQYYISGTFRSEEGYTKRNQLDRYAARVRVDHSVSDDFKVGLSVTPTRTENFRVATSNAVAAPFTYSALHFPNVAAYNEDGSINYGVAPNAIQVFPGNPLGNQEGTDFISTLQQVVASANAEYLINDNFMFNTDFTADLFQLQERQKVGGQTTDGFPVGAAFASNDQYLNYNLNATVTYKNNWEDNNLTILAGTSLQKSERTNFSSSGNTFANDKLKTLNSAATITGGGGSGASFAFQGYLSRINYSYKDRYLLTVTGRYDGSSRFGEENRYGFFPAASAGWIVTDEDFLQSDIIDFLKLRSSYGITGNAEIGNFPSLGLIGFGGDYSGLPGGSLSQLANPGLKWERTTQVDFGLDYGFLGSRIRGAIAYFIKDTDDLLLNVEIPSQTGFTS
ncbi:MAG: SusC/RagA family TonB-linked outer membrane protein, partial [Balneolaceae bacterium]